MNDDDDDSLRSLSWKLDFVVISLSKTFFDVFYYRPPTLNGGPIHPGSYELSFCIVQQLIIINLCMFFLCSPAVCTRQTCKLNNNKAKRREKHQFTLCSCSDSRFCSGPFIDESQFSICSVRNVSDEEWRWGGRRTSDEENTWSQITSENVNQYWLIFDCFQIIPLVDQLKIEYFQQSIGREKESFFLHIVSFGFVVFFEMLKTESWKGWFSVEKCFSDVSFMCFGDIQQMIDVEREEALDPWLSDEDTERDSLRKKYYPKFSSGWVENGTWRQENLNGTMRVQSGRLAKCFWCFIVFVFWTFCETYSQPNLCAGWNKSPSELTHNSIKARPWWSQWKPRKIACKNCFKTVCISAHWTGL